MIKKAKERRLRDETFNSQVVCISGSQMRIEIDLSTRINAQMKVTERDRTFVSSVIG